MNAELRLVPGLEGGRTEINLSIPSAKARLVFNALRGILPMAGLKVRRVNEEGEELFTSEEVFPDGSPAMALCGLRGKEDITQTELATRLGISQNMVSDMESGKRNISLKMAKRIGEEFKIPYKCFL
ncbi:MAG: helix-turn-helix domain-containing protein [Deltaproteobacteria bacterium]|jgi:DNA-binding XRE family transcriptional regulator|nr:helix-turn-helix domain-containing protein [Deltaproteobacteria bacterium]